MFVIIKGPKCVETTESSCDPRFGVPLKALHFFTSLEQQEDTLPPEMNVQNGKSRAKW